MFSQFVTDISTEHVFDIGLGVSFFLLGVFVNRKVNKLIEKKAKRELENKARYCQRIIDQLNVIQEVEIGFKDTLTNYQLGDPTNESLKFYTSLASHPITYSIMIMRDAIEQLQGSLDYVPLREEFLGYIYAFEVLPKRILEYNQPQQNHERDGLLDLIDQQMKKIHYFVDKFTEEMPEKREDKPISSGIDYSKYPNAPNLAIYVR